MLIHLSTAYLVLNALSTKTDGYLQYLMLQCRTCDGPDVEFQAMGIQGWHVCNGWTDILEISGFSLSVWST